MSIVLFLVQESTFNLVNLTCLVVKFQCFTTPGQSGPMSHVSYGVYQFFKTAKLASCSPIT